MVSLVVLAACGGDDDGGDGAFELPPPGEYSFEVTGTMEIEFFEEEVSAAPLALGAPMTSEFSGGITIKLGENGKFTITDKEGVNLVTGDLEGGPIRFTQNEEMPSTGTISDSGMTMELNVLAELRDGVTATHQQPIILEGPDNPFSDEEATLSTPDDAEPLVFLPVDEFDRIFGLTAVFVSLFGGFGIVTPVVPPDDDTDLPPDDESVLEFSDSQDDATDCATGETVDDPAVDIQSVSVRQVDTRVEVEVSMGQSPKLSFEEAYSMAIILLWFGWEGLAEFHAGERRQGQTDSSGNVIPGTEDDVTVTDDAVTFVIRDVDSIPDGSELEVEAFSMENQGSSVNCDTFMETLSLD